MAELVARVIDIMEDAAAQRDYAASHHNPSGFARAAAVELRALEHLEVRLGISGQETLDELTEYSVVMRGLAAVVRANPAIADALAAALREHGDSDQAREFELFATHVRTTSQKEVLTT